MERVHKYVFRVNKSLTLLFLGVALTSFLSLQYLRPLGSCADPILNKKLYCSLKLGSLVIIQEITSCKRILTDDHLAAKIIFLYHFVLLAQILSEVLCCVFYLDQHRCQRVGSWSLHMDHYQNKLIELLPLLLNPAKPGNQALSTIMIFFVIFEEVRSIGNF